SEPGLTDNEPGVDIQAVDTRVTDTQLQVFLGINHFEHPVKMPSYEAAWRYKVTYKLNGKTLTFGAEQDNPALPSQAYPSDGALFTGDGYIWVNQDGDLPGSAISFVSGSGSHLSWVVFTAPRDKVEKLVGQSLSPGTVFTNVTAETSTYTYAEKMPAADTLASTLTGTKDQLVLDDACFGPPPTSISGLTLPASVVYGHSATMSAVLQDENGKALAGKPVNFVIQDGKNTTVSGTTDANGLATATFPSLLVPAGHYTVLAQFPGEGTTYKTSTGTGTLVVSAQPTTLSALKVTKPSATTRLVSTTLLDDMKHPVAGVSIDWYVDGKKTTTTATDKTGKAVLKTAKPGQKVQARFAGKPGIWLAAASAITKVA
ncbi:MAG: Ig-like domain-containing protein, partial [Frankiaceae bacterium]|nr:Ig-like domain-containing protein [Frankiaceae bacterium]